MPRCFFYVAVAYYALNPIVGNYVTTVQKDPISASVFLLFMLMVCSLWRTRREMHSKKYLIAFVCVGLLLSLTRNNCIFAVFAAMAALVMICAADRKCLIMCALSTVSLFLVWNQLLLPFLGVAPGKVSEALSIPYQQTARYVSEYPDEVTEEERTAIEKVLVYEELAEKYNPLSSDGIRENLPNHVSLDDTVEYLGVWAKMFLKHPMVYIEATLINDASYLFPAYTRYRNVQMLGARPSILEGSGYEFPYVLDAGIRDAVVESFDKLIYVPGYGLLCTAGFYTWVLAFVFAYMVHRKRIDALAPLVPMVVVVLTCLASPLGGSLRYMLPVVFALPVVCAFPLLCHNPAETQEPIT